ncbi:MAG: recombinase family protein, partial [Patescibacteria group bacterium]
MKANIFSPYRPLGKLDILALSVVHGMLKNPFYYGEFIHGGVAYKGKHEPIITKELFNEARAKISSLPKGRYGEKMFAFTRIMVCGQCG